MVKRDKWVSFDNEQSVKLKADLAWDQRLAGVMVWSIETDDFQGLLLVCSLFSIASVIDWSQMSVTRDMTHVSCDCRRVRGRQVPAAARSEHCAGGEDGRRGGRGGGDGALRGRGLHGAARHQAAARDEEAVGAAGEPRPRPRQLELGCCPGVTFRVG